MADNRHLQIAKNAKDDEFYTTYETVAEELSHYVRHFVGKTVLCNCDDPFESNFCKYFLRNFKTLSLKRLVCTSYAKSSRTVESLPLFRNESASHGMVLDISSDNSALSELADTEDLRILWRHSCIRILEGDGDFRSPECVSFLDEADIVVTNPPFSLFREIVALVLRKGKRFLMIGNQNALTYKEIFPMLQKGEIWTGYRFGDMKFTVPPDSPPRKTRYWVDKTGQKWRSIGNAMWLTNLDNSKRHERIRFVRKYDKAEYPRYDDFAAIHVAKVEYIPRDYHGIMGVPITVINKYNPAQLEMVGEANHGCDSEFDLFKPTIGGKEIFKRILVRNMEPEMHMVEEFTILDLFCGAGGFSWGMEKNQHFKTAIALDFNEAALRTFKRNIPDAEAICGDITDEAVKAKIVGLSRKLGVNMVIGGPPCQGFSLKGKKLGLDDPRNYLFREYLKIVEELRPEIFVIENVKALLSTSAGWFRKQIAGRVKRMGYNVEYGVLNAADFGVPQLRQRAIFICSRQKAVPLPHKTCTSPVTVHDAISDLAYLASGEGNFEQGYAMNATSDYQRAMRRGSELLYNHKASRHAEIALEKLAMIPPECGKEFLPKNMLGRQKFSGTWGRLKWDSPSPTIDTRFDAASNGTNNHPFLHRAITPREAARIQSFDDRFVFLGPKVSVRQQIGNAVPPLLAKAIADKIYAELGVKP